jgi:hypothetical protein
VTNEVPRGPIRQRRRGAKPEGERQAVDAERKRGDRDEREEKLGESSIEAQRTSRHVKGQGVRDGRSPKAESSPEETGAQRAAPPPPGWRDAAQDAHLRERLALSATAVEGTDGPAR